MLPRQFRVRIAARYSLMWSYCLGQPGQPLREDNRVADADLLDQLFWEDIARNSPELVDNPDGLERVVYRFVGQYLPALLKTRTKEDGDQVWLAFWSYLVAPASGRKPFGLSNRAADNLIADFQNALREPT